MTTISVTNKVVTFITVYEVEVMLRTSDLWPIFVEIGKIANADPRYYQVAADWTPA